MCLLTFTSIKPQSLIPWSRDHIKCFDGSLCFKQIFQVDNINLNNLAT